MEKIKKFTIINVFDKTFSVVWQLCKNWKVWSSYIIVLALLSIISGNWTHTCKDALSISWWCANDVNVYVTYARVLLYFILAFMLIFAFPYDVLNSKGRGFKAIVSFSKEKIKCMGFTFGMCALFFALLGVCVWLIFKKANPNWLIEFGYFLIVFAFATVAVLILRTSAVLGVFLRDGKTPDFGELFKATQGKFYVVLLTFCGITYVVNLLQMNVIGYLEVLNIEKNSFVVALGSEFASSVLKIAVLMIYTAYFSAQAEILKPREIAEEPKAENDNKPAKKSPRKTCKKKKDTK